MKKNQYKSIKEYHWLCKKLQNGQLLLSAGLIGIGSGALNAQTTYQLRSENPFYGVKSELSAVPIAADIDGDGKDELFFAGDSDGVPANARENLIVQFKNIDGLWQRVAAPFAENLEIQDILDTTGVYSLPSFVDFDDDGDVDLFLQLYPAGIKYYKNENGEFKLQADEENPFQSNEEILNSDGYVIGDLDGDKIPEAIVLFEDSTSLYKIQDGKFSYDSNIQVGNFIGSLFDVDNDGDLDYVVGNKYGNLRFYENVDGVLAQNSNNNPLSSIDHGSYMIPAFVDNDGDGDIDVLLGSETAISYFKNEGGEYKHAPYNIQEIVSDGLTLTNPEFVDIDGDGDLDIFVGSESGKIVFHENNGGRFTINNENNPFNDLGDLGSYTQPRFGDVDGDGDMDVLVADYGDAPSYLENVDGVYMLADSINNPFSAIDAGNSLKYAFEDYDDDGDIDLFIGNKYGEITVYANTNGVFEEVTVAGITDYEGDYSVPAFADIDNDGDRDLIIGNSDGPLAILYKENGAYMEDLSKEYPFDNLESFAFLSPAFGDIDLDGDDDILVGTRLGELVFLQNQRLSSSIPTLAFEDGVKVFPNPTKHVLNIDVPWKVNEIKVQITSLDGRLIYSQKHNGSQFKISTGSFDSGYYTIVITGDQYLTTKKFVKID